MAYIAGVDVGNNTTEVAVAQLTPMGEVRVLSSSIVRTVGMKGTLRNALGVIEALDGLCNLWASRVKILA